MGTPRSPAAAARRIPREPRFLSEARSRRVPEQVAFTAWADDTTAQAAAAPPDMPLEVQASGKSPAEDAAAAIALAAEFAERVAAAVGAMRLTTERLTEQVRSDTLEMALLIARKLCESEITTSVEPLFGLIRSMVRKVGESRRIVVHLCPPDAARVEAAGGVRGPLDAVIASVEIHADPALGVGDCVVEADFGLVDGRLETRTEEIRRALAGVLAAAGGT